MGLRRVVGIGFLVLAGLFLAGAIRVLSKKPNVWDPAAGGIAHTVGTFLPAMICLIIAAWMFQKPKKPIEHPDDFR